jgi:hypothetical protein
LWQINEIIAKISREQQLLKMVWRVDLQHVNILQPQVHSHTQSIVSAGIWVGAFAGWQITFYFCSPNQPSAV